MADIESVGDEYAAQLRLIVERHAELTGSTVATALLADWPSALARFSLIMPRDFKRVIEATKVARANGSDVDAAVMAAARG